MQVNLKLLFATIFLNYLLAVHGQDCKEAAFDHFCHAASIQAGIDDIFNCGPPSLLETHERQCRRNTNGNYCGLIHHDLDIISDAVEKCLNMESEQCPEDCYQVLLNLRNKWGCCINEILNISVPTSQSQQEDLFFNPPEYRQLFLYSLWTNCCVLTVPDRCSSLPIVRNTSSSSSSKCGLTEVLMRVWMNYCQRSLIEPEVEDIRQKGCPRYAKGVMNTCGVDMNGKWCSQKAFVAQITALRTQLETVETECQLVGSCNSMCKTALESIKDTLGCCTQNLYNNSYIQTVLLYRNPEMIFSTGTWEKCGVLLPEQCTTKLFEGTATSLHVWSYWKLLEVAILSIFLLHSY